MEKKKKKYEEKLRWCIPLESGQNPTRSNLNSQVKKRQTFQLIINDDIDDDDNKIRKS